MTSFLVADDDPHMRRFMTWALETHFKGSSVLAVAEPRDVLPAAVELKPQIIFLDWVYGRGSEGPRLCAEIRRHPKTRSIPVVLMSGLRTDLGSRADAAGAGANVHLSKPFTVDELTAFTAALLKRSAPESVSVFTLGSLRLKREARSAWWGAKRLPALPPVLFELLWTLARHSPEPVTNGDAIRLAWKRPVRDGYVAVAVDRLRQKLQGAPGLSIEPVPGKGYRLISS